MHTTWYCIINCPAQVLLLFCPQLAVGVSFHIYCSGNDCLQVSNYRSYIFLLICNLCLPLHISTQEHFRILLFLLTVQCPVRPIIDITSHLIYEVFGQFAHWDIYERKCPRGFKVPYVPRHNALSPILWFESFLVIN